MEHSVPETRENRPVWPARPFARRAAPFTLVFESLEIDRVCPALRHHRLGWGHWPFSAWMPVVDVEFARDHHRQTAVCRLLKNRGRVFCWGGAVRIHTSGLGKVGAMTMPDSKLYQLVIDLVDAARDLPAGDATHLVRDRLIEVIRHLESQGLIPQANWSLGPR